MNVTHLKPSRARAPVILFILLVILGCAGLSSLSLGRYHVPAGTVARILLAAAIPDALQGQRPWQETEWIVVWLVRLPRVLVVIFAGMGLALSGATLQGVFRNPLVGPHVVGVSSGAAFGGVLAILLSLPALCVVGLAFGFGILSLVMVFGLSRLAGRSGILSGAGRGNRERFFRRPDRPGPAPGRPGGQASRHGLLAHGELFRSRLG